MRVRRGRLGRMRHRALLCSCCWRAPPLPALTLALCNNDRGQVARRSKSGGGSRGRLGYPPGAPEQRRAWPLLAPPPCAACALPPSRAPLSSSRDNVHTHWAFLSTLLLFLLGPTLLPLAKPLRRSAPAADALLPSLLPLSRCVTAVVGIHVRSTSSARPALLHWHAPQLQLRVAPLDQQPPLSRCALRSVPWPPCTRCGTWCTWRRCRQCRTGPMQRMDA